MIARRGLLGLCCVLLSSMWTWTHAAAAPLPTDRPLHIAVFGDSVTRGTMADAQLGKPNARFYADMFRGSAVAGFYSVAGQLFGLPLPSEDDISFIEKNFSHMSRLNLSAFVGSQEYSLPVRIEQATSYRPQVYNGAILAAGYRTADIPLTRFERHQRSGLFGQPKPDVVVVNYNGMDFINNVAIDTFTKDVARFFTRLKKIAPEAIVFVTEISNPIPLLTAPNQLAVPPSVVLPKGLSCHEMYRTLQFGARSALSPDSSDDDIARAEERLATMRDIMASKIDELNRESESGKLVLVENLYGDETNALSMLSADCIHPYYPGQRVIGNQLWNAVSDYFY